jgi:hypothetical protein
MGELIQINGRYHIPCSFLRSKACYDALTEYLSTLDSPTKQSYTHIYNLLIQDAFLSWCKVFDSNAEDCHWKKLIDNSDNFKRAIFSHLQISEDDFKAYWESVIEKCGQTLITNLNPGANLWKLFRPCS